MDKLKLLRSHLINAVPVLRGEPERLLSFIEGGTIEFLAGDGLSHQYKAPARLVLLDYTGSLDAVLVPLFAWLAHYEPGLKPEAVAFEAEITGAQTWDLSLLVPLTERVIVYKDCATGALTTEHRIPQYPRDPCTAATWQLWVKGPEDDAHNLVAEWDNTHG